MLQALPRHEGAADGGYLETVRYLQLHGVKFGQSAGDRD